ncbi:MAG: YicC family protein [Polyangiaceae bacterium]|jgi:uncharacterized protein (TIGR00255 family)|nr:YicC family protein [Polyangiaceae bacterium]
MTGFGVGREPLGQGRVVVELRSVNHRFLDVRVRAPREMADLAMHLEQLARQRLKRGRFELVLRADGVIMQPSSIDTTRAAAVYGSLCVLRDQLAPGAEVPFQMLASVPDIFVGDAQGHRQATLTAVEAAFETALRAADAMRSAEGEALRSDLATRLGAARSHVELLAARRLHIVDAYRGRLRDRVQRMLDDLDISVDPSRVEQEVVIAAERCDIEEELTRLSSHFSQFDKLCRESEPVGRRLDFLLQEMSREVNTIGAKSQDAPVAHAVVELKSELERMREQVQNVE